MEQKCKTCKWHDDFSWVCFNGDSENVADFTDNEDSCKEYFCKYDNIVKCRKPHKCMICNREVKVKEIAIHRCAKDETGYICLDCAIRRLNGLCME